MTQHSSSLFLIVCLFICFGCNENNNSRLNNQTKEHSKTNKQPDDNYFIDLSNIDKSIYSKGKSFYFDYFYEDSLGKRFLIQSNQSWKLVSMDSINEYTITKIKMTVTGKPYYELYKQIEYQLIRKDGKRQLYQRTGLIEDSIEFWTHPPRELLFKILEISPFPQIKKPFEIGKKWSTELQVGAQWGDKRWATWDDDITVKSTYIIERKAVINTSFGKKECWVVKSYAESSVGNSSLDIYFNEELGFVLLEYTNINNSRIVLELKELKLTEYRLSN